MADQGGSRRRWPMKFRMVPVQIADKVAELSGAHSRQSSGGLRYKNLPRSSKLLGIAHEFISKKLLTCHNINIRVIFSLHLSEFGFRRVAHIYSHKKSAFSDQMSAFLNLFPPTNLL